MIFSLDENVNVVLQACVINSLKCPVTAVKVDRRNSLPEGVIDFASIMDTSGKNSVLMLY